MSEVPEDSSIEWEAAQWVARRMSDEPFDESGFEAWLAGDPRHKPLFEAMWPRIMGSKMGATLEAVVAQRRRSKRSQIVGGIVGALALFGGYQALPSVELLLTKPQVYTATGGTLREVALEDGTHLTLAAGTDIRVRYAWHNREVELKQGTVFASVAHDETRPFRIDVGAATIMDLGTRFEVSSKPSFVRVTVESGSVRFRGGGWFSQRIDLTPGQAAVLNAAHLGRVGNVSQDAVARWRTGWVEYHDASIREVVTDLEGISTLPIRISPGDLANLRVSGRIRLTDPQRQLDNLAIIHNFTVDRRSDAIILSDRK